MAEPTRPHFVDDRRRVDHTPPPGWVVTVTPTGRSGAVVRWYETDHAAVNAEETVSASRNGVMVASYLHEVPGAVLTAANAAYETLRDNPDADLSRLATPGDD